MYQTPEPVYIDFQKVNETRCCPGLKPIVIFSPSPDDYETLSLSFHFNFSQISFTGDKRIFSGEFCLFVISLAAKFLIWRIGISICLWWCILVWSLFFISLFILLFFSIFFFFYYFVIYYFFLFLFLFVCRFHFSFVLYARVFLITDVITLLK